MANHAVMLKMFVLYLKFIGHTGKVGPRPLGGNLGPGGAQSGTLWWCSKVEP